MIALNQYANADASVISLLKHLGITVNPTEVIEELEKHPDYPSLLAVNDVLNWFKIDCSGFRVNADEVINLQTPFIAHTNRNDDFVTVSRITENRITLSDHKNKNYQLGLEEFKKIYSGVILHPERPLSSEYSKANFVNFLSTYKMLAALLGLGAIFIFGVFFYGGYVNHLSWQVLLLTCFKTTGVIISTLLLIQSIDRNNPLVQTLCGGNGKINCNAILTSKAANVFTGLTWSEVGFFYFLGTWLGLLFNPGSIGILQALAVLNVVSLPYTIYSINYQLRIAKQWCLFCTLIQALLWLELLPLFSYFKSPNSFSWNILGYLGICLMLPITVWVLLKPLILKIQQLGILKRQLKKFKYNKELFVTLLNEQPKYAMPDDELSIVLGNSEANTIITMVSNPYCAPCSETHRDIDEILDNLDDIQVRIIFTASNDIRDIKTPVTRHLMALNMQKDKSIVKKALQDWHNQKHKNYEDWAKSYPVLLDESKFNVLERQKAWCNMAEIKATPTLLINGYCLPEVYRLHDIKYMLG